MKVADQLTLRRQVILDYPGGSNVTTRDLSSVALFSYCKPGAAEPGRWASLSCGSVTLGCFTAWWSQGSKMVKAEPARAFETWAWELASCHFHCILLVKASHKTSPDTRGEAEFQTLVAICDLLTGFEEVSCLGKQGVV